MIYFDNAATSFPKPKSVVTEIVRCLNEYGGNAGRSSHKLSLGAARAIYRCREVLAEHYGYSKPENITFTYNCTYALNTAIKSRVRPGDHVIISDIEHNSVLRPLHKMQNEGRLTYSVFPTNGSENDILQAFTDSLTDKTKTAVVCHRSNICNRTLPIEKIGEVCKKRGITIIVDSAQASGSYKYSLDNGLISVLCAPGHKGMYGIQGVGYIVNCDGGGGTVIEGGGGIDSFDRNMPRFMPDRLEAGTINTPGIAGLMRGAEFVNFIGAGEFLQRESHLCSYAKERLGNMNSIIMYTEPFDGGTLLFNHKTESSEAIASILAKENICVRSGFHCSPLAHKALGTRNDGAVRLSFGYFNTKTEIDTLIKVLSKI